MHWIVCNWNRWLTLFEWWIHFILECLRLFVSCCWVANLKHTRISYVQLNKASTSQIIIHHFFLSLQILLIKRVFFHFRQMIKKFELTPYKSTIKKKKQDWTGYFLIGCVVNDKITVWWLDKDERFTVRWYAYKIHR